MDRKTKDIYGTAYAGVFYKKELRQLRVREADYLIKKNKKKTSYFEDKLSEKIPEGLEDKLQAAFAAGFKFVFDKGTEYIMKTYSSSRIDEAEDKGAEAKKRLYADMGLTFAEGAGLGALGVGIPDIPVFICILLRNLYQIAEVYDFDCESKAEKLYALKLIEAALIRGMDAEGINDEADELSTKIDRDNYVYYGLLDEQIERTATALAEDMLYMKFVQTIPVVGAIGGIKNLNCMKKVGEYADIKYHKRQIMKHIKEREETEVKMLADEAEED